MTQQAFVIDQGRCIGCHACTVACKVEHGVELGVFRTRVKYIERGEFPDTRRLFSVLRCNHCTDAPCVNACPVTALYGRHDGIVDFDHERCIGCKACMNACPYDALYIDPESHTAAKCNFCAHRAELDLKPSCEVVCPVGAIISGDVHDPESEVSRLLGTVPSEVRSPEQGTRPNVYYIGADPAAIDPLVAGGGLAYLTTALARPASGALRRPIWLFRPVKPVLDAYLLPDDELTRAARAAAEQQRPDALEFHKSVDWSPEQVWGPRRATFTEDHDKPMIAPIADLGDER